MGKSFGQRDALTNAAVVEELVMKVLRATASARNETQLRHEIENALEAACVTLSIPWTPFQLDRGLRGSTSKIRFVDVAHGAVVIEYEPPQSFAGRIGAKLNHARKQVEEYAQLLAEEEGRPIQEYVLIAWDGLHINFGRLVADAPVWETLTPFDQNRATRLLRELRTNGIPLVHPKLLANLAGPDSEFGVRLVPLFFSALQVAFASARTTKTKLLFTEWRRLFGQVVGIQSDALRQLLHQQGATHSQSYDADPSAYLFALNTYIALLAKLVAASALPNASQDIHDASVPIATRVETLESGVLFEHAGVANMLNGDFFSWYRDDVAWAMFAPVIDMLVTRLTGVSYDVSKKLPESTRDLFKGIYETFVPRALRHALGEFYTPDWLAEYGLTTLGWQPGDQLLDPTCGSGTFVLEGLRRRLASDHPRTAQALLDGLYGFDLNPLAVLSAKGSLAVYVAPYLDPENPVRLPIYLADAINPASPDIDGCYAHVLQTELGVKSFRLPQKIIVRSDFFKIFARVRDLVDAVVDPAVIASVVMEQISDSSLDQTDRAAIEGTVETLCELHNRGWNGIWCPIVADRFAAGAIPPVKFVCGNPPWVKWSHLPPEYASFIGPRCRKLGVFSSDRWVGGIESDISTVITFEVIDKYLAPNGMLGFFITGTVFTNESSEGFRQFTLRDGAVRCAVRSVDDFTAISPFDGVSNRPTFLLIQRDAATAFPVPYRLWSAPGKNRARIRWFGDVAAFVAQAECKNREARPVPGGNGARPWLIGTAAEHRTFAKVFSAGAAVYTARKGVTTDRNGIFWVQLLGRSSSDSIRVRNAAHIGRTKGIAAKTALVEVEHLFPLLRGRGVAPFDAQPDSELRIMLPQRGMHGDPDLPISHPETFKFLKGFKAELEGRSSYKRFQARAGHPFYSLWSTGPYTFAPYKVLWREMGGRRFAAAYIGDWHDSVLGRKCVIPDHKVYFIPVKTQAEAAYLTGVLNSPIISAAVSAYASQLSLGASVAEYLHLPRFDGADRGHARIKGLATRITQRGGGPTNAELLELDAGVRTLLAIN